LKDYEWKRQNPAQNMSGTENESKWFFDSVPEGF
jgi:hypothetical protein